MGVLRPAPVIVKCDRLLVIDPFYRASCAASWPAADISKSTQGCLAVGVECRNHKAVGTVGVVGGAGMARRAQVRGASLHIGVNTVDAGHHAGRSGPLAACEFDARDMATPGAVGR